MAANSPSDAPPPEVPEEFAAAYREAFNRALEDGRQRRHAHEAGVEAVAEELGADTTQDVRTGQPVRPGRDGARDPLVLAGTGRVTEYRAATPVERVRESRWLAPLVGVVSALVLVGGAYAVGRSLSQEMGGSGPATSSEVPASARPDEPAEGADEGQKQDDARRWGGEVREAPLGGVTVDCVLAPGVDAGGREVGYEPANLMDGDPSTAWRCEGDASGTRLHLRLPAETEVGKVGLIPGYAKTDPVDGADRYAENNRITKVRWHLGNGVQVDQRLDGSADNREMQSMRVPRTTTTEVVLEIVEVTKGPRNTTAISEVSIGAVAG